MCSFRFSTVTCVNQTNGYPKIVFVVFTFLVLYIWWYNQQREACRVPGPWIENAKHFFRIAHTSRWRKRDDSLRSLQLRVRANKRKRENKKTLNSMLSSKNEDISFTLFVLDYCRGAWLLHNTTIGRRKKDITWKIMLFFFSICLNNTWWLTGDILIEHAGSVRNYSVFLC